MHRQDLGTVVNARGLGVNAAAQRRIAAWLARNRPEYTPFQTAVAATQLAELEQRAEADVRRAVDSWRLDVPIVDICRAMVLDDDRPWVALAELLAADAGVVKYRFRSAR